MRQRTVYSRLEENRTVTIQIHEATPNMCVEICNLLIRAISESCSKDHHNDPDILQEWLGNKTPQTVKSWLEVNRTYCAFSTSGKVVGVLQADSENRILLNYVDPNCENEGIGTKLLQKLESENGEGNTVLVESTKSAKPFYLKKGFKELGGKSNAMAKRVSL
jgi:hypothetical protein